MRDDNVTRRELLSALSFVAVAGGGIGFSSPLPGSLVGAATGASGGDLLHPAVEESLRQVRSMLLSAGLEEMRVNEILDQMKELSHGTHART